MNMQPLSLAGLGLALIVSCGGDSEPPVPQGTQPSGSAAAKDAPEDHAHDEVSLGKAKVGDLEVELAQGHGGVVAGKEGHLVVKLPYNDAGATTVRAWIGTSDRNGSMVGKGTYAPSHDDYDVHADAPKPLPTDALWWVEVEKPDGTKLVGSAKPIIE